MGVHVVTNTRGHRRYTETLTGRCTICDMPTATECACGRCLDLEPWHLEHTERSRRAETPRWFDHWEDGASREHRGYQDDAEAERRANEL